MLLIKQDVSKVKYVQSRSKSAKRSENVFINEKLLKSISKCAKNEESMKKCAKSTQSIMKCAKIWVSMTKLNSAF